MFEHWYRSQIQISSLDKPLFFSSVSVGGQSVVKGCVSKSICDAATSAGGFQGVSCCEGNLCNGAESVTQSVLFLCGALFSFILLHWIQQLLSSHSAIGHNLLNLYFPCTMHLLCPDMNFFAVTFCDIFWSKILHYLFFCINNIYYSLSCCKKVRNINYRNKNVWSLFTEQTHMIII